MASAWIAAPAARSLLQQATTRWPARDKSSDGLIGDAAHSSRVSDHNPDSNGIVLAVDLTHDPAHGCDCGAIFAAIAASRDPRVKYAIHNRRIVSATTQPWVVRPYTGSNPHTGHLHVSIRKAYQDDASPWPGVGRLADLPVDAVLRLYRRDVGHFYTASPSEAESAIRQGYRYEGIAWGVNATLTKPVYRFRKPKGGHFYTASEDERAAAVRYKRFVEEGVAFNCGGDRDVIRYRHLTKGWHFYTASPCEKPGFGWVKEGLAFRV